MSTFGNPVQRAVLTRGPGWGQGVKISGLARPGRPENQTPMRFNRDCFFHGSQSRAIGFVVCDFGTNHFA